MPVATAPITTRGEGRPKAYRLLSGTRVPSVTTITKRFADSGGLIQWAYQQGIEGNDLNAARDSAAAAGHLAHALIEAEIHGATIDVVGTEDQIAKARNALGRFKSWIASKRLEITHTEMPLVSEQYQFGGTLDALGQGPNGEIVLIDWKTSNGTYPEYVVQLGGYAILCREALGLVMSGAALLRFDKDADAFSEHYWGTGVLDEAKRAFLMQRELYESDKFFKRVVK